MVKKQISQLVNVQAMVGKPQTKGNCSFCGTAIDVSLQPGGGKDSALKKAFTKQVEENNPGEDFS